MTVWAFRRECLFGEVVEGEMVPNPAGRVVTEIWERMSARFETVSVDHHVVMPNHFHGVVMIIG
jgi:REP element-mobilizing transposase RayT